MKYLTLAVLALAANYASAYCPNLCSGHGTCGVKDSCECFEYTGTQRGDHTNVGSAYTLNNRDAWTGADCSLRTCPLAFSWSGATPNGLTTVYAVPTAVTALDYVVTLTDPTSTTNAAFLLNKSFSKGSKILANGVLKTIRSATWSGDVITITTIEALPAITTSETVMVASPEDDLLLDAKDADGAHGQLECAGQGVCDRTSGNCECFPGYEGEACTRSVCPNSCSGNGICLSAARLSADASQTYAVAWDADKHFGCKCDLGFRGPDCSLQECPSDFDPLHGCGGGQCNLGTTDNSGAACPAGIVGVSDCAAIAGGEQRDCSGRGICDYETGICKCFSGFFGEACEKQTILI